MKVKISLKDVEFFAFHGFYPEERSSGHYFLVTIDAWYKRSPNTDTENISNTINYENLFLILKQEMEATKLLIESVAECIVTKTFKISPQITKVNVSIKKKSPQLGGVLKYSKVTMSKSAKYNA